MSMTLLTGMSSIPISRPSATLFTIERPRKATLRPEVTAASATWRTRWRCEAKLATIIRDITERKRMESRLAEREAQLALFVEHAPAGQVMLVHFPPSASALARLCIASSIRCS